MSPGEIGTLVGIISLFVTFAAVLFWASRYGG